MPGPPWALVPEWVRYQAPPPNAAMTASAMTLPTIFERRLRRGVLGVVCESIAYPCIGRWHGESVAPAEVEHTQAGRPFFGVVSVHSRGSQELKVS